MAEAPARAALAGNPSDGYGGVVVAVTIPAFVARVSVATESRGVECPELLTATLARFQHDLGHGGQITAWETSIPRSVGLGGSSALVIATLRALCERHGVRMEPEALAELALSIERDDLGIAAGLQDRIAQSYGGLTFMDFGEPHHFERLDRVLLPPLLIGWRANAAESSGVVHSDLRARFEDGEPMVRESMQELASLARMAREAILRGDTATLASCADGSFEARARMLELDPRHLEMVECGRAAGAGVNYTGSGGAVVCICRDRDHRSRVAEALHAIDCETVEV
jgi:glucuronokinase